MVVSDSHQPPFPSLIALQAIVRIFEAGRRHGKWLGILALDPEFARWAHTQGARFICYQTDLRLLKDGALQAISAIRDLDQAP